MAGFEREFVLGEAGFFRRLRRDRILAGHLLRVLWMWATVGRRLRREYRRAQAEETALQIDHLRRGRV